MHFLLDKHSYLLYSHKFILHSICPFFMIFDIWM